MVTGSSCRRCTPEWTLKNSIKAGTVAAVRSAYGGSVCPCSRMDRESWAPSSGGHTARHRHLGAHLTARHPGRDTTTTVVELVRVDPSATTFRVLGVRVCGLASAVFWAFEHEFVWAAVWRDAFKRPFVTTGLITLLLLLPLAMTSTTWAMRALGARWKSLHRLIYLAVLSACLHFFLHRAGKNNYGDPALVLGITMLLLGARAWWSYGMRRR